MKRGLDWYAREPRSFLDGVRAAKMTARQVVIYGIIIDLIYDGGGETPDDPKHIASYLSDMGAAAVRATVDQLIAMGKIYRVGDMLHEKRAETQAKTRANLRETRADAGRLGGISSGEKRRNALKNIEAGEANASSKAEPEKIREDKKIDDDSARAREKPISLKARLAEAMGLDPEAATICDEAGMAEVKGWMKGYGLRSDEIVSVVAEVMAKRPDKSPPSSLTYFAKEMARLAEAKASKPEKPAPEKRAEAAPPATEDQIMRFYANWINSDRPIPASTLKPNTARAMLDAGLVTPDQLRAKGIAH